MYRLLSGTQEAHENAPASSKSRMRDRTCQPNLLSLPEDLFIDIGSWLNVRDVCSLELACRKLYDVLLIPSRVGAYQRPIKLKLSSRMWPPLSQTLSPRMPSRLSTQHYLQLSIIFSGMGAVESSEISCRWFLKRTMRYSHVTCSICVPFEWPDEFPYQTVSCEVSPLLPSLLAALAPSAQLSLSVPPEQGKPAAYTCLVKCATEELQACVIYVITSLRVCHAQNRFAVHPGSMRELVVIALCSLYM